MWYGYICFQAISAISQMFETNFIYVVLAFWMSTSCSDVECKASCCLCGAGNPLLLRCISCVAEFILWILKAFARWSLFFFLLGPTFARTGSLQYVHVFPGHSFTTHHPYIYTTLHRYLKGHKGKVLRMARGACWSFAGHVRGMICPSI